MHSNTELIFSLARQVAMQSDYSRAHVGCIITYKGKPIVDGCNAEKTHPIQKKYNRYRLQKDGNTELMPKMHAEICALSKLKKTEYDSRKLALYVYRIRKDRDFGMARPCPSCMKAIKDLGIKNIYYTTDAGYAEETISY